MRTLIFSAALIAASFGAALAQVQASSSVYFIDVDTARYAGPEGQRLTLRVGDPPRQVTVGDHEEICLQLQRDARDSEVIRARVRALGSDDKVAEVRLVAPDISPGTYRSTPWGLLLRALPERSAAQPVKTAAVTGASGPESQPFASCTI